MTNAEARCNKSLRPRKPEGSLGRTAQDVHLDSHTAPELLATSAFISALWLFLNTQKTKVPVLAKPDSLLKRLGVLPWYYHAPKTPNALWQCKFDHAEENKPRTRSNSHSKKTPRHLWQRKRCRATRKWLDEALDQTRLNWQGARDSVNREDVAACLTELSQHWSSFAANVTRKRAWACRDC